MIIPQMRYSGELWDMSDYAVTAHAEAAAKMLCRIVRELRTGRLPEELGEQVQDIGAMMARRV